jgi:hypothetical protein
MSKKNIKMAIKTLTELKTTNKDFGNLLDSVTTNLLSVEDITAARTLTKQDSGKIFMLDSAGGAYEITLPVAANLTAGWNCKFIVKEDTPTGDITIAAGSAIINGVNDDGQGNVANSTAGTAVSNIIVEAASKQGDFIDLFTDGTTYYFHAVGSVDQAFTTS